jgi:hypothetical protein
MKKAVLLILIAVAVSQAKAQQFFNVKPSDSLKNNLFNQYFKVQPQNKLPWVQPQITLTKPLAAFGDLVKISPEDNLPIAFLQGYSKMPVVKLEGTDKMPVLKMGNPYVQEVEKITP